MRTLDLSAVKKIPVREGANLELRFEMFNVLNRANFGNPTLIAFAGLNQAEAPLSAFGRIRSTVTSSRQTQVGIRLVF